MARRSVQLALASSLALAGCHADLVIPALTTNVVAVVPSGGATNVDANAPVAVTFNHPMRTGMEQYAALHDGSVSGPVVPGMWTWSADHTTMWFTPTMPLDRMTEYTLHLGGGMRATDGSFVDFDSCTAQHGGQWATQAMMGGGMMGGGSMMGAGWRHPNGTYGMVFTFTTA